MAAKRSAPEPSKDQPKPLFAPLLCRPDLDVETPIKEMSNQYVLDYLTKEPKKLQQILSEMKILRNTKPLVHAYVDVINCEGCEHVK